MSAVECPLVQRSGIDCSLSSASGARLSFMHRHARLVDVRGRCAAAAGPLERPQQQVFGLRRAPFGTGSVGPWRAIRRAAPDARGARTHRAARVIACRPDRRMEEREDVESCVVRGGRQSGRACHCIGHPPTFRGRRGSTKQMPVRGVGSEVMVAATAVARVVLPMRPVPTTVTSRSCGTVAERRAQGGHMHAQVALDDHRSGPDRGDDLSLTVSAAAFVADRRCLSVGRRIASPTHGAFLQCRRRARPASSCSEGGSCQ
jgi:hypothetical protein